MRQLVDDEVLKVATQRYRSVLAEPAAMAVGQNECRRAVGVACVPVVWAHLDGRKNHAERERV